MKNLMMITLLFFFNKSMAQNIGINNKNPLGKLSINTPNANWNEPSILLIDSATDNSGGAVLEFRNALDKRTYIQGNIGTIADGSDSYLTFAHNGFYNMRLRGDGLLGIGTTTPSKAGLEVNKKVGKVLGIFGSNEAGVAIESNMPGIHFNSYNNDGSRKSMVTGYAGGMEFNYLTGDLSLYNSSGNATAGSTNATISNKLFINNAGNVGIGVAAPQALLHINGNLKINSNNNLEFGSGLTKETNAGKMGYALFTPQTLDIVGAGTGSGNRRIRLWAEEATEFTGNADVFGNMRIRALQTNSSQSKRNLYADSTGLLHADGDIKYKRINAVDFKSVITDGASMVDTLNDPGGDLFLFKHSNSSTLWGKGYFTYPLSKLPYGAKIVSIKINYLSKKPENTLTPSVLKARICVSLYTQMIDPVFGGISYKTTIVQPGDYTVSTSQWRVPGGGFDVTNTMVNNNDGYGIVGQNPTSIIIWSVPFNTNGSPVTTSDFKGSSSWPINRALSFHSIEIGYKL